ncbi:MAG: metalloregulator ArsR/SmtB family transcription factor [Defluviitaleaceae bacterium]|nr:metalloregulator ArsR/SmtB family transcription factor [Defluviitaleaceae bacterium]
MNTDIITLFKCLADKSRIQIIKSLALEEMYVERLAERLGLSPPTVSFHLKKMEAAGIVTSRKEQYYTVYTLRREALTFSVLDIITDQYNIDTADLRDGLYRQSVLSNFMEYGKLKSIPVQSKKREIVLEEIAKSFRPNLSYSERDVNIIIADFHDDFCTIRREMVGLGILQRDNGIYRVKRS